ncbi:hypothetical protein MA47_05625 [Corynebacterium auriscanis]|uniref:Uncharacterized protein n=1 Tax=Corynebacterium auriscanis TaxID=99807 RepID=A0A0A2DL89_9CORY|nr:hypothetical protein MA47_05625 [Corynebacterium auriscanis]
MRIAGGVGRQRCGGCVVVGWFVGEDSLGLCGVGVGWCVVVGWCCVLWCFGGVSWGFVVGVWGV